MIHKARTLVTVVLSCSLLVPLSTHSQTPKRTVPSAAEISTPLVIEAGSRFNQTPLCL